MFFSLYKLTWKYQVRVSELYKGKRGVERLTSGRFILRKQSWFLKKKGLLNLACEKYNGLPKLVLYTV